MKRIVLVAALGVLPLTTITSADAVTHSPCTYRYASPPSVQMINNGVTTLQGSGSIGGCPSPIGTESATITVTLQHLENGVWVSKGTSETSTRTWSRITRGSRQTSAIGTAVCVPGDWRTDVTGGDGFAPAEWASTTTRFTAGDSGVCGSYGGGD